MTNEDAIRIINSKAPLIMCDREGGLCDKTEDFKSVILSALEKQIPQNLENVGNSYMRKHFQSKCCPICKTEIYGDRYCRHCGQAIDWSK